MHKQQKISLAVGIALGVVYGLVAFRIFDATKALPGAAFLFLVPAAMGAVPLLFSDVDQTRWYVKLLLVPWLSMPSFFLLLVAVFKEGGLCLFALALPMVALAMLGTFIAWVITARRIRRKRRVAAGVALLVLPLVCAPAERALLYNREVAAARSHIVVEALPASVWEQLAEVPTMQAREYRPGPWQRLGVPRPIRATVDRKELGGRRIGQFDRGLRFDEIITAFEAPARMAFSIAVDAATLRRDSAERHAFENGYFRFIDATYALAELPRGPHGARAYVPLAHDRVGPQLAVPVDAALDRVFQDRVLAVIKARSERPTNAVASSGAAATIAGPGHYPAASSIRHLQDRKADQPR